MYISGSKKRDLRFQLRRVVYLQYCHSHRTTFFSSSSSLMMFSMVSHLSINDKLIFRVIGVRQSIFNKPSFFTFFSDRKNTKRKCLNTCENTHPKRPYVKRRPLPSAPHQKVVWVISAKMKHRYNCNFKIFAYHEFYFRCNKGWKKIRYKDILQRPLVRKFVMLRPSRMGWWWWLWKKKSFLISWHVQSFFFDLITRFTSHLFCKWNPNQYLFFYFHFQDMEL